MPESSSTTLFHSFISWLLKTAGSGAISKLVLTLLALLLFSLNLVGTRDIYPTGGVVARGAGGTPIKAELVGHAELAIPANRAVLTLRIASSGISQTQVADNVRGATDDVLESVKNEQWAPVVELSVNTVSSDLRRVNGFLLGEKDEYEAKAVVSATFEARQGFDVLSSILVAVGKMPTVTVQSLKWSLDSKTRKQALAQIRADAVQDAVDKLRAYAIPLLGKHVSIRA
ncbi:hypothetical protein DV737_g4367, partial [Chaetothyriales sp. CBS 132003]